MNKAQMKTAAIAVGITFALMAVIHKFQPMDLDETFGLND